MSIVGAPPRFAEAKYDDVPVKIQELFSQMRKTKRGMYIYGPVGTGKTHIAYALKGEVDRSDGFGIIHNTTELLDVMRADFDRPANEKRNWDTHIMKHEGLLVLDDVGSEKISDWVMEKFYLIVNNRYQMMLPTIFTSNLSISDLGERIGDRTVSRIVEMSDVIELTGKDRRILNKQKITVEV